MTWLHTWAGLLLGWVLFAMFLTGTAAYYRWETTRWMQPELQGGAGAGSAAALALARLESAAPDSPQWFVDLPDARNRAVRLLWRVPGPERRFTQESLDPAGGGVSPARDTLGGDFLYRFHFQFHLPPLWGRWLAGLAAMFMLTALATGVIAHRRFFADFFTFRPGLPGLRSWLDFHNLAGVLSLPFCLMIAYSGLVILSALYMPWGRLALGGPSGRPAGVRSPVSEQWIPTAPLEPMLRAAAEAWREPGPVLRRIEITGRGTPACTVTLVQDQGGALSIHSPARLRFNGVTGERLATPAQVQGIGGALHGTLYGMHLARFASPFLRALLFLLGLLSSALIGTGLVLWTLKRRRRGEAAGPGLSLVERLNLATLAGLPLAIAAFFWANRLLPAALATRSAWEVRVFFIAWMAALFHALLRPNTQGWREQLGVGALLYLLLPLLDCATAWPYLQAALLSHDHAYLGFLAAMPTCGLVLFTARRRLSATPAKTEPPVRTETRQQKTLSL